MILIPIPDHTEQMGNARRAALLDVAKVIDQSALTPESLTSAVECIIDRDAYRTHAVEISHSANTLNAISLACNTIENLAQAKG
jgi:UDP:flavonoid glycosyltransferase YjiC (YdhE family)